MKAILLAAILAQDAGRPGENDAPVLINEFGNVTTIVNGNGIPPGTACLTFLKAQSVRDDLVSKNARIASLEATPATPTGAYVLAATLGAVVGAGIALGVACGTGHCK